MTNTRIDSSGIETLARIGKALDHPIRIRALAALRHGELCVCELIELFELAPSTVSKHMSLVADAGLVSRRRDGKWTYYSFPSEPSEAISNVIALVEVLAGEDPVVGADRDRLGALCCASGPTGPGSRNFQGGCNG